MTWEEKGRVALQTAQMGINETVSSEERGLSLQQEKDVTWIQPRAACTTA